MITHSALKLDIHTRDLWLTCSVTVSTMAAQINMLLTVLLQYLTAELLDLSAATQAPDCS